MRVDLAACSGIHYSYVALIAAIMHTNRYSVNLTVANAFRVMGRTDVDETIKFVSYFDTVNVMNLNSGKRKDYQLPHTSASDSRLDVSTNACHYFNV
jgi:hypothetical protein